MLEKVVAQALAECPIIDPPPHEPTVKEIVQKATVRKGVDGKEPVRDAHGRLTKGHSGNPAGMPPGTPSLVRLLKKRLENHPEDADAIVNALVKLGKTGDMRAIEQLIDRIDGKVIETHKIEGEMPVTIMFVPAQRLIESKPVPQIEDKREDTAKG